MTIRNLLSASLVATALLFGSSASAQITAQGSDSTIELVRALSDAWREAGGEPVRLAGGGSSSGVEAALGGSAQLAFLSRGLKRSEIEAGLVGTSYALDGVAVVVHPSNRVSDLSREELAAIYTGETTRWPDRRAIRMFTRPVGSGSREVFEKAVLDGQEMSHNARITHGLIMAQSVSRVPTAIGYVSLGQVFGGLKAVAIDGVEPTGENVRNASYPLARTLTLATRGSASAEVQAFIDFVRSPSGQDVIRENGFVALVHGD